MNSSQHTQFSPDQVSYLTDLMVLDKTNLSSSGGLVVDGDIFLNSDWTEIKFPFEAISGHFSCNSANLSSLINAPVLVGKAFDCRFMEITSLEHAPQSVGAYFSCANTDITSFDHAPQSVGAYFNAMDTKITSLKGIHKTHRNWKIGGILYLPDDCADIVGLALIDGINRIYINGAEFDISDHDPHTFQEKLLDAGMKCQARM